MEKHITLTAAEEKLAALIWREAPLSSPDLVALAQAELNWKKSTTYTVLKKLCDKSLFRNNHALVSVRLTQDDFIAQQSRMYVEDLFGGSLPRFITAFIGGKGLSTEQAAELKRLIDEHESEGGNG